MLQRIEPFTFINVLLISYFRVLTKILVIELALPNLKLLGEYAISLKVIIVEAACVIFRNESFWGYGVRIWLNIIYFILWAGIDCDDFIFMGYFPNADSMSHSLVPFSFINFTCAGPNSLTFSFRSSFNKVTLVFIPIRVYFHSFAMSFIFEP